MLKPGPGQEIGAVTLDNPFNEKETLDDKLSVLDVKARDQSGRQLHLEMQMAAHRAYFPNRVLYFCAKFFTQQLVEGQNYARLQPTYSICFVNDVLFPQVADHHLHFRLWAAGPQVAFTDRLAIHIFELPKFTRGAGQLADPLEVWLYFLRHGEGLDPKALPRPLDMAPIHRALEELTVFSQSDHERERYEARLKWQRDQYSFIAALSPAQDEAQQRGLEQGLKQGLKKGLEQGQEQGQQKTLVGQIRLHQRLLGQPVTPEGELLAQPLKALQSLADQLTQALLSRPA